MNYELMARLAVLHGEELLRRAAQRQMLVRARTERANLAARFGRYGIIRFALAGVGLRATLPYQPRQDRKVATVRRP